MFEKSYGEFTPGQRVTCALVAAHLALSTHIAPPEEQPVPHVASLEQPITPSAADYAAIDTAIAVRDEVIDISQDEQTFYSLIDPGPDTPARNIGVVTHEERLYDGLGETDLDLNDYREASDAVRQQAMEQRNELKPALFAKLQELASELYGVNIVLRTEPQVFGGPADARPGEYPVMQPASLDDVSFETIYNLAGFLAKMPGDFLNRINVDTIRLFKLQWNEHGRGLAGTVDGHGALELAVDANEDTGVHEAGHDVNRNFFGEWYAYDPVFDGTGVSITRGEGLSNRFMPNEQYEERIEQAIQDARDIDGDDYYDLSEQQARCVVAEEFARSGNSVVAHVHDSVSNSEEDKAELFVPLLTEPSQRLLDRCKPKIFAASRELLARLHTIHPLWARWLAAQHAPSSFVPPRSSLR